MQLVWLYGVELLIFSVVNFFLTLVSAGPIWITNWKIDEVRKGQEKNVLKRFGFFE